MTMTQREAQANKTPSDRREFFRWEFRKPLKFRQLQDAIDCNDKTPKLATTTNVSQSGILFKSKNLPKISSILWMDLDLDAINICQEIRSRALIYNHGFLGRVVRLEEDSEVGSYSVGVCFVTKDGAGQELKV